MIIKEMCYYENTNKEEYKETDFCKVIKEIILSNIKDYKQSDIDNVKSNIINEIKEGRYSLYSVKKLERTEYKIIVGNEIEEVISIEQLKIIIGDIRERYIYEEALMQLFHESKLIPTIYQRLIPKYQNNSDIRVNILSSKGNKYIYIFLDLMGIKEFKTSVDL